MVIVYRDFLPWGVRGRKSNIWIGDPQSKKFCTTFILISSYRRHYHKSNEQNRWYLLHPMKQSSQPAVIYKNRTANTSDSMQSSATVAVIYCGVEKFGLSRLAHNQEIVGSNPTYRNQHLDIAQFGRVPVLETESRGFKSYYSDQIIGTYPSDLRGLGSFLFQHTGRWSSWNYMRNLD